jgi:hypothetical protein
MVPPEILELQVPQANQVQPELQVAQELPEPVVPPDLPEQPVQPVQMAQLDEPDQLELQV